MAYVRNKRGTKSKFKIATVSNRISKTYHSAMGVRLSFYRKLIQGHSQKVYLNLRRELGDENGAEWPRSAIKRAIAEELRVNAPMEVYARYMEEERRLQSEPQDSEESEKKTFVDESFDPVWTVHHYYKTDGYEHLKDKDEPSEFNELGLPNKRNKVTKKKPQAPENSTPTKRSDWVQMFQVLAARTRQAFDFELFEKQILSLPPTLRHLDADTWWNFWQGQFDLGLKKDPRLIHLMRVILERRERTRLVNQHWLAGTPLMPKTPMFVAPNPSGDAVYRILWKEYITDLMFSARGNPEFEVFDLEKLSVALTPIRDLDVDWRGVQWLLLSESLWKIRIKEWKIFPGRKPHEEAYEPIQWALMRTAMGLAIQESDPTQAAIRFYNEFSHLRVLPSETMMREAGKLSPSFLEDESGSIKDQYEAIYEAIHRAAVRTKWTGTMTLDWRHLRSKGASIAGRRISQGPLKFMESINSMLESQGRQDADKPVTVILPLWHRDIEKILEPDVKMDKLQCVVSVPDLFFKHLQAGKDWLLADPVSYPEILVPGLKQYHEVEARWLSKNGKKDHTIKSISSDKIWRKLLRAMSSGKVFVLFENSDLAFAPFPDSAPPVGGIDGVGAIPISADSNKPYTSWPAAAVNFSKVVDQDGSPNTDLMMEMAAVALRILDNAIELSNLEEDDPTLFYRPVCLGTVGFFEAVNKGISHSHGDRNLAVAWASGLSEAWAKTVLSADQELKNERGVAPAFELSADARSFDPLGSIERLKQSRDGSIGHKPTPHMQWSAHQYSGHRFSTRTVWAPYLGAAKIAGVTPGGIGTLRPTEVIFDDRGEKRNCPTPLLLEMIEQRPEEIEEFSMVMKYPDNHKKWPNVIVQLSFPTVEGWENRLMHAASIRPWIDQGVSLTLPSGLSLERLANLTKRAWWLGLSNIRFEGFYDEESEKNLPDALEKDIDKTTK